MEAVRESSNHQPNGEAAPGRETPGEWMSIGKATERRDLLRRQALQSLQVFRGLSTRDWRKFLELFHEREFQDGETVFEIGVPGLGMYVVVEGGVRVLGGVGDRTVELARLGPGDHFGEMALIDEVERSATVVSVGRSRLLGIFRPDFWELVRREPRLGAVILEGIAKVLVQRLRLADRTIENLNHKLETLGSKTSAGGGQS